MHEPATGRTSGSHDPLASWKEIDAYLGRDVPPVRLWKRSEGLPVHRHMHAKQGSVYALRSELDVWRRVRAQAAPLPTERAAELDAPIAARPRPWAPRGLRQWITIAVGVAGSSRVECLRS